jgi:hypothetical protein
MVFVVKAWRSPGRRIKVLSHLILILGLTALISGWWYYRNLLMHGSLSGEQQEATLKGMTLFQKFLSAPDVAWSEAADSAFFSHIWFGAWSFLQLRWWIYYVFKILFALAVVGLCVEAGRHWLKRNTRVAADLERLSIPLCLYGFFLAGLAYHVLISFLANAVSATCGWYIYAVGVAQAVLLSVGWMSLVSRIRRLWIMTGVLVLFVLLDLYGVHFVLVPYHTGLIAHTATGALETLKVGNLAAAGVGATLQRLAANKPLFITPTVLFILYLLYLSATLRLCFQKEI